MFEVPLMQIILTAVRVFDGGGAMVVILVPQKIPALLSFTAVYGHAIHVKPENIWARSSDFRATIYLIQRPSIRCAAD